MKEIKKYILTFIAGLIAGLLVLLNHNATKKTTKGVLNKIITDSGKDSILAKSIEATYKKSVKVLTKNTETIKKEELVNKFKEKFKVWAMNKKCRT